MKKIYPIFIISLLAAGCAKEGSADGDYTELSLDVSSEVCLDAKTSLGSDGTTISWSSGDMMSVLTAEGANTKLTTSQSGTSVKFTGISRVSNFYTALYPYDASASMADGVVSTTIPDTQSPVAGNFDPKAALAVAHFKKNGKLEMKNVCSAIKLNLTQTDVVKVTISALGGKKICGPCSISIGSSGIPTVKASYSTVYFEKEDASAIAPGVYYIMVAPTAMSAGVEIIYSYSDGKVAVKTSTTGFTPLRSRFHEFKNAESSLVKETRKKFPMLDDDFGPLEVESKKIYDKLGIKVTFSLIPANTSSLSAEQEAKIKAYQAEGFSFAMHPSHSPWMTAEDEIKTGGVTDATLAKCETSLTNCITAFENSSEPIRNWKKYLIYPGSSGESERIQNLAKKYGIVVACTTGINGYENEDFVSNKILIRRLSLATTKTEDDYKDRLRSSLSKGYWIASFIHCAGLTTDAAKAHTYNVLRYFNTRVQLCTLQEAIPAE